MPRPAFISLDGLDGTGKSTQCRLLADWLRASGHAVTTCIDPGGTPLGGQLRALVLHYRPDIDRMCEALLFMASRCSWSAEVIRPALDSGHIVVSDRFLLANVVYQGHAGGLDVERLWEVGRFATGGLEPDLTLVLDLPPEQAAQRRGRARRSHREPRRGLSCAFATGLSRRGAAATRAHPHRGSGRAD